MSATTNSLDFNPVLKVVSCTLSSASSISWNSLVKCFTYDLRVSFFPFLVVSRWFAGLFGRCPLTKWHTKELPNCLKLSMDDVGSLLNHTHATPLRVVGKEMHNISSGGYWRPRVVLKVVMWSSGSFRPSNDLSCGRWNFEGTGHSSTLVMKGESVLLTIPSKFRSVFSLITLLSSSISLLISLRRSEFASSRVFGRQWSFLLWLSSSSFQLVPERLSSCWSCNLISWFCLVHFSMLAMSVWIYRVSAGES